ncbi:m-AAA protease-interacting protein 1, mitochondrial [Danaus plexippus]|nr:m-AAA protease-interacting protein 1, mitochondrial [Danaus plexippus]
MLCATKHFAKSFWPLATRIALKETLSKNYKWPSNLKTFTYQVVPDRNITSFKNDLSLAFKALESRRNENSIQNSSETRLNFNFLKDCQRAFSFRRKDKPKGQKRRIPKLILIQNPFSWLMVKIDFSVLRHVWDPSFKEKEFKFATKQAISRITEVISHGQLDELNGLLTKAARLSLLRELDLNWGEKQRRLLALKKEDIQISSPRKVYFIRIADKKFCDVDMAFLALKWAPINNIDALIFTEIFARFHREYTPHCIPEWTIAYFKVTRFEVLRR